MEKLTKEQQKLVEDNIKLIYFCLKKYDRNPNDDDWYGAAAEGLCRAAMWYEPDKGEFSSYATKCIFRSMSKEYANSKKQVETVSEAALEYIATPENHANDYEAREIFNSLLREETKKNQYIIQEIVINGVSQNDVAKKLGVSRQRVNNIYHKFREKYADAYLM